MKHPDAIQRASRQSWVLFSVVVVLVFTLATAGFVLFTFSKERSDARASSNRANLNAETIADSVQCITTWAKEDVARQVYIQKLEQSRTDALDALVRAIGTPGVSTQAAIATYLLASDSYHEGLKLHPLPSVPTLNCDSKTSIEPIPAPTVTKVVPGPTVTKTPAPVRTTAYVPGPTVRIPVPGPTVYCHNRNHCGG